MRIFLRLSLLLTGIFLTHIALSNAYLRQKPSTAYWVLGETVRGRQLSLYLSAPNGRGRRLVDRGRVLNMQSAIKWLPDGRSFVYIWYPPEQQLQLRHFSFDTPNPTVLMDVERFDVPLPIAEIPSHDAQSVTLHTGDEAIFAFNNDGHALRQLTPFHRDIYSFQWSSDGEWLFYVTSDIDDPPNTLYRQRFDGSQHTELMRFKGNSQFGFWHDTDQSVMLNIYYYPDLVSPDYGLYRISTTDNAPTRIVSEPMGFSILGRTADDWIILNHVPTNGRIPGIYRVRGNGTDFSPVIEIDPCCAAISPFYIIPPHDLLVGVYRDSLVNLSRINLETLDQTPLFDGDEVWRTGNYYEIQDRSAAIFDVANPNGTGRRVRLDFSTFDISTLEGFSLSDSDRIATIYQSYALIIREQHLGDHVRTTIYRLDTTTGATQEFASRTSATYREMKFYPTPDGRHVIISFEESTTLTGSPEQLQVDVLSGAVEPVSLGKNLLFSPYIDKDLDHTAFGLSGVAMMLTAIGWIMLRFWCFRRSS